MQMLRCVLFILTAYLTIRPSLHAQVDTAWVRRYNGPGNGSDYPSALAVDDYGNVYVTGRSYDSLASIDYATIKYSPVGDLLWVGRYNGPGNGNDYTVALAVDNG